MPISLDDIKVPELRSFCKTSHCKNLQLGNTDTSWGGGARTSRLLKRTPFKAYLMAPPTPIQPVKPLWEMDR